MGLTSVMIDVSPSLSILLSPDSFSLDKTFSQSSWVAEASATQDKEDFVATP